MNSFRLPCVCASLVFTPLSAPLLCHAAPGDLDVSFGNAGKVATFIGTDSAAEDIVVQPDGRILVVGGGGVTRFLPDGTLDTSFNGTGTALPARGQEIGLMEDGRIVTSGGNEFDIVRVHPNGTSDLTLNGTGTASAGISGSVERMAIQSDGKVIVAGAKSNGAGNGSDIVIVRYNLNGSLDTTFGGTGIVISDFVFSEAATGIAVQQDGKIVVAAISVTGAQGSGSKLAVMRYNSDGSLDTSFNGTGRVADIGDANANAVTIQTDGKIVVVGDSVRAPNRRNIEVVRYNSDGSPDASFSQDGRVTTEFRDHGVSYDVALQRDGKIVIAGAGQSGLGFTFIVGRYNTNGTLDTTLGGTGMVDAHPGGLTGGGANGVAVQRDGKILAAGRGYNTSAARVEMVVYRFEGGPYPEITVEQPDGTALEDGNATVAFGPVLLGSQAEKTFTVKNTGEALLTELVPAINGANEGDFTVTAAPAWSLPAGSGTAFTVRFTPRATGMREAVLHLPSNDPDEDPYDITLTGSGITPEIRMELPDGTEIADGAAAPVDYGIVISGIGAARTFTIRNTGTASLNALAVSKAAAGMPADFTFTQPDLTTLPPDGTTTFTVTFSPQAAGARTTTVLVASDDADENPYEINLTGTQATASEAWRITHFNSPANSGPGADLYDADGDGLMNLMEFATGSNPNALSPPIGQLVKNGNVLEFIYPRRKAALAEVKYDLEASATISGTWSHVGQASAILSDDGITQQVKATYPAGSTGKRFVRLRVTRN